MWVLRNIYLTNESETALLTEPDTPYLFRLQNWLFGPFVPEQQL
jgi:hypothetical protein